MTNPIRKMMSTLLAIAAVAAFSTTWAQLTIEPADEGQEAANPPLAELQNVQQEAQVVQERLAAIAEEAQRENPELMAMQRELGELFQAKLKEYNYPNDEEMAKIQETQARLQSGEEIPEAERAAMIEKFQEQVAELQQAQQQAQQDPEVQKSLNEFNDARDEAMAEVDEDTPKLLKKQEELYQKMQQLQVQVQQMQNQQ